MRARHIVHLTPDDKQPIEITTWRVEGGWVQLILERGGPKDLVEMLMLPPTWPTPVTIITTYEEEE